MKAKFDYKSKKAIIIAIIVLALIIITGIGVGLFLKGNNDAEAVGNNTVGNTIDNDASENTPSNNQTDNNNAENTDNNENDGENANVDNNENANNEEDDNQNENDNTNNNAEGNQNQGNANNNNNVTMQEFITERIEVIPERVISENYWVTWKPTQFKTLVSGEISLEKANIEAEKTVAKLTTNGLVQNPESVKVGEILQYTIKLTNTNTKISGLVNVADEIPAGTEFISATETNLKTTPAEYENPSEVTKLEWKNVKVKAGSEVTLVVYVKVVAKTNNKDVTGETALDTTSVQNTAKIYDGTTPEEDVPSPETKVANITSNKTSKVIYNEEKPHEHIVVDGIEPLHEQDIIEYTITLTNVGEAAGTVKVSDTVPEGTTFIKGGVVTVVDKNGTTTYEIDELIEGIDVTVAAATEEAAGVAIVTFRVVVNSFDTETKQIVNDMAKVDGDPTNSTEDEAEKVYIDIPVTKVWANLENDAAQVYSLNSIKFQVKNGEAIVAEKIVAETADSENGIAGEWSYTFTELPKYDANGNEINYTVVELAVNDDEQEILNTYYNANTETQKDLASTNVTITNTFDLSEVQEETIEITATKVWANMTSDAAADYAISSIILQVKLNGEVVQSKAVTAEDSWAYTFTGLKKYDENGNELVYAVDEAVAEEDADKFLAYDKEISGTTITNTFNPSKVQDETIEITATKVWANMNSDAAADYAIASITLQVKLGETVVQSKAVTAEDGWAYTFTGLKKYDGNGNELVYTVDESVAEEDADKFLAYDKEISGTTITNTFNPSKITDTVNVSASKVWANMESDAAKIYAIDSIKLQVLANGKVVAEQVVAETADEENKIVGGWSYTFTNLPKYDAEGNKITYTVGEAVADTADQTALGKYTVSIDQETGVITNTFDPSKLTDTVNIPASKVWENMGSDAAKAYALTSIKLQLLANGKVVDEQVVALEADAEKEIVGEWKYTFTNLPKYDAEGEIIKYTVGEAGVNEADQAKLEKFITTIDQEKGIITNTFDTSKVQNETTEITITKVWEDNLNAYSTRPDSVTLTLSNGTNYTLEAPDAENNTEKQWTQTINNLPKYDANGNIINYTVTEVNVPEGYTKVSETGTTVTNRANVIVEKSAYKANEDGTIGSEATTSDVFKANDTVYYKLTFKNAGNTVIDTKTLTDILPLRLKLLAINGTEVTDSTVSGTDSNGYTWTLSENAEGNTVINWTLTEVAAGEAKELTIKAKVVAEAEYKDLCQKLGETTSYTATLYVRKDGEVPYEGSNTTYDTIYYTSALGTVYLTSNELFYDTEANLKNDDLYYLIKNNNQITEMVSKGITRAELEDALADNGITLATDEVVVWYVIKSERDGYHIDGVIRKISDLTSINNAVYMDNVKQDDVTIDLEDIEIGQRGTVTVKGVSQTSTTVVVPMDVVFILDTSGSMEDSLSSNNNNSKANSMVNAVNSTIATIMSQSSDSRIGVVGYSDSASTIIPLANYSSYEGNYLTLGTSGSGKNKSYYIQSNVTTNSSRTITGGTNTQSGIKAGAEMLTNTDLESRTFTKSVNGVEFTGTRTPVIILVTDGQPTYCYKNETATGNVNGEGYSSDTDEYYYYWTIRTASYYKGQVKNTYYGVEGTQQAKMFTIGIGIGSDSNPTEADYLAKALLNPNKTNVDNCNDNTKIETTTNWWGEEETQDNRSMKKKLYDLLNTPEAGETVANPYKYSYADASKTGSLTESDIQGFLNTSLNASSESFDVRSITVEESAARRINLTNIDTSKEFLLQIIISESEKIEFTSLTDAQNAENGAYVKEDTDGTLYVDLSNIDRTTTVNITYWEQATSTNAGASAN